jgi:hypothetical protein
METGHPELLRGFIQTHQVHNRTLLDAANVERSGEAA